MSKGADSAVSAERRVRGSLVRGEACGLGRGNSGSVWSVEGESVRVKCVRSRGDIIHSLLRRARTLPRHSHARRSRNAK